MPKSANMILDARCHTFGANDISTKAKVPYRTTKDTSRMRIYNFIYALVKCFSLGSSNHSTNGIAPFLLSEVIP